jgi:hypothetical protein
MWRQGLYPLFKRSAFHRGTCTKLNAVSNRGKCVPQATQQGDVHEQNAASNLTGRLPATQQGDAQTHHNQTKNTAICAKNESQWFCSWEVVLALVGILVCGRLCWQNGCLLWFVSSGRKKPYLTLNYQFLHRNINFAKSWQKTLFLVSKFGCKFCRISYL